MKSFGTIGWELLLGIEQIFSTRFLKLLPLFLF